MSLVIKRPAGTDLRDHFWFLRHRADVLKCCGNVDNLLITEFPNRSMLAICKVCWRKHRKVLAEPGKFLASPAGQSH